VLIMSGALRFFFGVCGVKLSGFVYVASLRLQEVV